MSSRAEGTNPRALGTNPRALSAADSKLKPGHLHCFICKAEFDPAKARINGRLIGPSAHCNDCLAANFKAGRWQEVFRYDCAGMKP